MMGHTPHDVMHQAWLLYLSDQMEAMNVLHKQVWLPRVASYEQQHRRKLNAALETYNRIRAVNLANHIDVAYPETVAMLQRNVAAIMNNVRLLVPRFTERARFEEIFMEIAEANLRTAKRAVDLNVMHADWVFDRELTGLPMNLWDSKSVADVGEEMKRGKERALNANLFQNEYNTGVKTWNEGV